MRTASQPTAPSRRHAQPYVGRGAAWPQLTDLARLHERTPFVAPRTSVARKITNAPTAFSPGRALERVKPSARMVFADTTSHVSSISHCSRMSDLGGTSNRSSQSTRSFMPLDVKRELDLGHYLAGGLQGV